MSDIAKIHGSNAVTANEAVAPAPAQTATKPKGFSEVDGSERVRSGSTFAPAAVVTRILEHATAHFDSWDGERFTKRDETHMGALTHTGILDYLLYALEETSETKPADARALRDKVLCLAQTVLDHAVVQAVKRLDDAAASDTPAAALDAAKRLGYFGDATAGSVKADFSRSRDKVPYDYEILSALATYPNPLRESFDSLRNSAWLVSIRGVEKAWMDAGLSPSRLSLDERVKLSAIRPKTITEANVMLAQAEQAIADGDERLARDVHATVRWLFSGKDSTESIMRMMDLIGRGERLDSAEIAAKHRADTHTFVARRLHCSVEQVAKLHDRLDAVEANAKTGAAIADLRMEATNIATQPSRARRAIEARLKQAQREALDKAVAGDDAREKEHAVRVITVAEALLARATTATRDFAIAVLDEASAEIAAGTWNASWIYGDESVAMGTLTEFEGDALAEAAEARYKSAIATYTERVNVNASASYTTLLAGPIEAAIAAIEDGGLRARTYVASEHARTVGNMADCDRVTAGYAGFIEAVVARAEHDPSITAERLEALRKAPR